MDEEPTAAENTGSESVSNDAPGRTEHAKRFVLSISGLVLSVIALGLAIMPAIVYDRGLPNPFAESEAEPAHPEPAREFERGFTVRFKEFSFHVGGENDEEEHAAEPEAAQEVAQDPVKWLTMAAVGCALVSLIVSSVGQIRERHTGLTITAMIASAAAITWQYLAIGIVIGAAAAAFLIVLAVLGSLVN